MYCKFVRNTKIMKNFYPILFTAVCSVYSAQTQITKASNDYLSGNTINNLNFTGTPDNSAIGNPVTFNNSALVTGAALTSTVSTPSAAETTTFPGSTIKFSDGGSNDIFYKSTAVDLQITGATIAGAVLNFSGDNAVFLKFPTAYSNTYTDTASGTGVYGATNAFFGGNITTTADAAGTLMLGSQTYNNVIRVKTFQDYKLFIDAAHTFQIGTLVSTIYTYYDNVNRYPLFTATTATVVVPLASINQTTNAAFGQANPTLASHNNTVGNSVKIYPNPATENLFLAGDLSNFETVKIFSVDGRLIKTQTIHSDKIDVSKLQSGTYILQLSGSNKKAQTINFIKK